MKRVFWYGALAAAMALAAGPSPEGQSWWRHIEYLASDKLQGRNAGSPGHKLAADYVAAQFRKTGLAPCGDAGNGYVQNVPLVNKRLIEAENSQLRARADYNEAVNTYLSKTGVTLRTHRVTVDK